MGVMPYISASIIVQMVSMVYPPWEEYRKEGESGRRKLTQITRYFTVVLGAFQSLGAAVALQNGGMTIATGWSFLFIATVTMTTGTMFLMWLGEQVTERGIGNGISMIILAGIVAGLPGAVGRTVESVNTGEMSGLFALLLIVLVLGVTAICVYVERAQRRIAVHYAKRQVGRRVMAGQTSHLPFKLGRDPADLRLKLAAAAGDCCAVLRHGSGPGGRSAADRVGRARLRSAAAPRDLHRAHHLLLLLLHGAGL